MNPVPLLGSLLLAVAVASLGAGWIGPGPFGPDGAGADAARWLGGHPYPLHPWLGSATGNLRVLSVLAAGLTSAALSQLSRRVHGDDGWAAGVLAACAPLLVLPATLAGGDAPAIALATCGWAVAWSGREAWRAVLGGAVAGLSLAVKPTALPALLPLLLTPLFTGKWGVLAPVAAALAVLPFPGLLDPLLRPREASGLLGSWFLATNGARPGPAELPALYVEGFWRLWRMATWTGHPVLGTLALVGAVWDRDWRRMALLALGALGLLSIAALMGDRMQPRYLAAASLPLVLLAARSLKRAPWLGLAFLWPALAFVSQLSALRAHEEALPTRPELPWVQGIDVTSAYLDSGVCGAGELRALAEELAALPSGASVQVLRLRDGRQNELVWPLRVARPDLDVRVVQDASQARRGVPFVTVEDASRCATPVVDPAQQAGLAPHSGADAVYGVRR